MRVRSFLIVLTINIFLMYMVTLLFEYVNLKERFSSLEETVSSVVDSSVDASIGAEELFSSNSSSHESSNVKTNDFLLFLDESGNFYNLNIYAYSIYFNSHIKNNPSYQNSAGRLKSISPAPDVVAELSGAKVSTPLVFSYLYGNVGSCWTDSTARSNLKWTRTTSSTINNYRNYIASSIKGNYGITLAGSISSSGSGVDNSGRAPTPEFKAFYNAVGNKVTSKVPVRVKSGDSFTISNVEVPLLVNMGLALDDNFTRSTATKTMQNYLSSIKVGKTVTSSGAVKYSTYFLTPFSLGVTYIPTKVLYPTLLSNFNTKVALNKMSAGSGGVGTEHYGCIDDSVYPHKLRDADDGLIVNDGLVEYDLSSLDVSVDYIAIDFKDWSSNTNLQSLIRRVEGSVASVNYGAGVTSKNWTEVDKDYQSALAILGSTFNSDESKTTVRIIARITTRLKVHIPYQCDLLKYNCKNYTGGSNSEHYDIKDYNRGTGKYESGSTGLVYEYVTYRCHAR